MNPRWIRIGLANRLATLEGVQPKPYVPDSIAMTTAVVLPGDPYVEFHGTMGKGRLATVNLEVLLITSKNVDIAWQARLDDLCATGDDAPHSVIDAIEADRTLGGDGLTCQVLRAHGWGTTNVGNNDYGSIGFSVQAFQNRSVLIAGVAPPAPPPGWDEAPWDTTPWDGS